MSRIWLQHSDCAIIFISNILQYELSANFLDKYIFHVFYEHNLICLIKCNVNLLFTHIQSMELEGNASWILIWHLWFEWGLIGNTKKGGLVNMSRTNHEVESKKWQ